MDPPYTGCISLKEPKMPLVVMTAAVADTADWEQKYRSHGDLFEKVWPGPLPEVHFTTTDANEVALCMEIEDVDAWFAMLARPEITEAMADDGVHPESVKVFVLDKTASF